MKKLGICILFSMLVAIPAIANIVEVKGEPQEDKLPEIAQAEILYQKQNVATKDTPLPNMEIWKIERLRLWPTTYYRIRWWIECTDSFYATFKDKCWLSDNPNDPHKWLIHTYPHDNEEMWEGPNNGPYKTPWFQSKGTGYYWITVFIDYYNNFDEGYLGYDDYDKAIDNEKTVKRWFWG
ncbi:MAG: hypothetical protein J7L20_03680 [Thermoplasmata archaeon]|nr:hypothetical protein [Thermoplasmata archaeon]